MILLYFEGEKNISISGTISSQNRKKKITENAECGDSEVITSSQFEGGQVQSSWLTCKSDGPFMFEVETNLIHDKVAMV